MGLIRLSEAIENLREELKLAQEKGENQQLQFSVESIEIELEVIAETEIDTSGKVNWWILGGGLETKAKGASKHKLRLSLKTVDTSGRPLKVSQQQNNRPD